MKFYLAVASDKQVSRFDDWGSCNKHVFGKKGIKFKAFTNQIDADAWLADPRPKQKPKEEEKKQKEPDYFGFSVCTHEGQLAATKMSHQF